MRIGSMLLPETWAKYMGIFIVSMSCHHYGQALDRHDPLRHFGRRVWQTDEGLPQNTVNDILQTKDGYLWIATNGGLARFDGIHFKTFNRRNTPQLHTDAINSLYQDAHGVLWISTADGLTSFDGKVWSVLTVQNKLPSNTVFSVDEDDQGTLWILTANGLAQDNQGKISSLTAKDGLTGGDIISVHKDAEGSTWIATEGGLDRLAAGSIRSIYKGVVTGMTASPEGSIWISTQQGAASVEHGKLQFHPCSSPRNQSDIETIMVDREGRLWLGTPYGLTMCEKNRTADYTTHNGLPGNHIHKTYEDREGAIWVSTDRGLARIVDGKVDTLTTKSGLSAPLVLDMLEDREGSLWLGTDAGGLIMLRNRKFTSYTAADGLANENTKAVLEDRHHVIWIGSDGGGLEKFSDKRFTSFGVKNGLSSDVVFAIAEDFYAGLWIGTPDGIDRLQQGHISRITSADGLPDDYVRSLLMDADGSLWVGTRHGLSHWQNGRISNYSEADGLSSDFIGAMTMDAGRHLWIGTSNGLDLLANGKFSHYTKGQGLSSNLVTALYSDAHNVVWIGTKGGGLNRLENGVVVSYASLTALPENIYGMVADGSGDLWFSSDKGAFSAKIAELNAFADGQADTVKVLSYGTADGMPTSECSSGGHPSVWKSDDDTLWFATPRGITSIQPERANYNRVAPPVTIEQVSIDDASVPLSAPLAVSPGHTRYAFRYAGLSFIAPQKVQFRYRLEGLDKSWIDAGTRRDAYYTNLKPGQYRFHVIAANDDGIWNDTGASFSFKIKPHIYQTGLFYCLLFMLLALLAYELYRWRLKRVELKFHATLAERNRIAREIHDTLAQGFVGISLQLEVAKRVLGDTNHTMKEYLDQALLLANTSLSEARRAIWDLRSPASGSNDLPTRLGAMMKKIKNQSRAEIALQVTGAYRPVPETVATELLKIAQEATVNAARHANAGRIDVLLAYRETQLRLAVVDDGRGFIAAQSALSASVGHFGLIGMKERAKLIGAEMSIESQENQGTSIIVDVAI